MGRLTTHVLDTAHGCPGAGIAVRLYTDDGFGPIAEATMNADGRCDAPLLEGPTMAPGRYVLAFETGAYFRKKGLVLPEPAFLDTVRIAFGIADASAHYHVPLLLSPYGYSTYRGS
ncbi:MAG: hydroxyisourate hydrolase [Rhizomicrobium sp.]